MTPNKDSPIRTINSSKYVVNDRFLKLRRDSCTKPPGGRVGTYYVLELKDWIDCIAIDKDANVIILRHYRHGVQKDLVEFIGGVEEGELAEVIVKHELEEKTGVLATFLSQDTILSVSTESGFSFLNNEIKNNRTFSL